MNETMKNSDDIYLYISSHITPPKPKTEAVYTEGDMPIITVPTAIVTVITEILELAKEINVDKETRDNLLHKLINIRIGYMAQLSFFVEGFELKYDKGELRCIFATAHDNLYWYKSRNENKHFGGLWFVFRSTIPLPDERVFMVTMDNRDFVDVSEMPLEDIEIISSYKGFNRTLCGSNMPIDGTYFIATMASLDLFIERVDKRVRDGAFEIEAL